MVDLVYRYGRDASSAPGGVLSTSLLLSAVGTSQDATVVKASAGRFFSVHGLNVAGATRYLKIYNKATAPSSADTPIKTIAVPASSAFALDWSAGYYCSLGIGFRLTTGSAHNDANGCTAGDILGLNVDYG